MSLSFSYCLSFVCLVWFVLLGNSFSKASSFFDRIKYFPEVDVFNVKALYVPSVRLAAYYSAWKFFIAVSFNVSAPERVHCESSVCVVEFVFCGSCHCVFSLNCGHGVCVFGLEIQRCDFVWRLSCIDVPNAFSHFWIDCS